MQYKNTGMGEITITLPDEITGRPEQNVVRDFLMKWVEAIKVDIKDIKHHYTCNEYSKQHVKIIKANIPFKNRKILRASV